MGVDWLSLFGIRAHQRLTDDVHIFEFLQTVAALAIHPDFTRTPTHPPFIWTHRRTYSTRKWQRQHTFSPPYSCICLVLSFIIQPIKVCQVKHSCAYTRAIVCVQSRVPSCSSSFAFNKHRAGGQRALLYIRSASSNSKRHQRSPAAILRVTMRWRAQWKLVTNVGSESRLSSARLCSASRSYSLLSAMTISLVFVGCAWSTSGVYLPQQTFFSTVFFGLKVASEYKLHQSKNASWRRKKHI